MVATVDDAPLPVRVALAKALAESSATATQEGFLGLLDRFLEGGGVGGVKAEAPEFLRRVRPCLFVCVCMCVSVYG